MYKRQIHKVIGSEEQRFLERLDQGTTMLQDIVMELENKGSLTVPGSWAFKLYDTYGFPLELTREIAGESGMTVDEEGFLEAMEEQRAVSYTHLFSLTPIRVHAMILVSCGKQQCKARCRQ